MYNLDIPLAVVLKLSWQILQLASPIRFFISLERKMGENPVTMLNGQPRPVV
jgi:hypothetical protein